MNQHFLSTLCFLCYSDLERVNPSRTLPPPPAAAAASNSQHDFVVDELKKALIWGSAFNVQVAFSIFGCNMDDLFRNAKWVRIF